MEVIRRAWYDLFCFFFFFAGILERRVIFMLVDIFLENVLVGSWWILIETHMD